MGLFTDWKARRAAEQQAREATRWVVIDTETSGLDMVNDRLIALAGVAVDVSGRQPCVRVADSFEVVLACPPDLQLDEVARRNILLHGVGRGEQRGGLELRDGLLRLREWMAGAPCLAFHAKFDATMLDRASRSELGRPWPEPWLDLAVLARVLHPDLPHRHLDDWLTHFQLDVGQRHRASSDAWATAELLQCLWPAWMGGEKPLAPWAQAQQWLEARRWVGAS
ncbi:MAG: 3'-5' exonuclease [Burkholderiales bacterium]|nr:3'-5' exonuclease [Burkholderiales bacterium]